MINTLWINNVSRAKSLIDRLEIYISFDTSLEDIEALRLEMENFVTNTDNKRDFYPDVIFRCVGVGNMDKLQIQLEVRHKVHTSFLDSSRFRSSLYSNWSVETVRAARHSKLMCALILALRKVPIFGPGGGGAPLGDPANPTYSVAVSDEMAATSRTKAAKDADTARLHPTNASVPEDRHTLGKTTSGNEALAPIPEGIAGDPLRDREIESDAFSIVGDRRLQSSTSKGSQLSSGSSMSLGKSKSVQGRRRPGLTVPVHGNKNMDQQANYSNIVSSWVRYS